MIVSAGASWAALDRRTGATLLVRSTSPGNYPLSAPVVDTQGQIYLQSSVTLHAFAPDGTVRWTYALDVPTSSEPESAGFTPTLVGDEMILSRSLQPDVAVDAAGSVIWKAPEGVPLFAAAHWGLGDVVFDLRTTKPAGRLRDSAGRDATFLTILGGRGIVAAVRESSGTKFLLLDTCGRENWSTALVEGSEVAGGRALVGPGEITYVQLFHADAAGNQVRQPDIIAISPDGQIVAGPIARVETPWVVGADGTLYALEFRSFKTTSKLVALSPSLEERWSLDVPEEFGFYPAASLSDDGALYAQGSGGVVAIQTTSPGLAQSSWPSGRHDNRSTNWGGGTL